jgi:hypothetical protein
MVTLPNGKPEWKAKPLSIDHKPDLPEEHERIIANNGRVNAFVSKGNYLILRLGWRICRTSMSVVKG